MSPLSCELAALATDDVATAPPAIGEFSPDLLRSGIRENSGANPHALPGRSVKPHARGLTQCDAAKMGEPGNGQPRPADAAAEQAIPADDWSVARLGLCSQEQSDRIGADERQVTPAYWLLGKALNAARKHFPKRGRWENWLAERGIGADRAQKARRLAAFLATPEDLAGLSLRQALRLAKVESPNPATAKLLRNFDRRLRNAVEAARQVGKKAERAEERAALSRSIQTALDALGALHCQLAEGEAP